MVGMSVVGGRALDSPPFECEPAAPSALRSAAAKCGPAFGDAAVDGGVRGVRDLRVLVVAVAQPEEVQRLALPWLERPDRLHAVEAPDDSVIEMACTRVSGLRQVLDPFAAEPPSGDLSRE